MSIEKLRDQFREVFEDETLEIRPEMTAADVETWDSFNHINLVVAIETAFDVSFTTQEIGEMRNVGDLVVCLKAKGIEIDW